MSSPMSDQGTKRRVRHEKAKPTKRINPRKPPRTRKQSNNKYIWLDLVVVRIALARMDLTRKDFAASAGFSVKTIDTWFTGRSRMPVKELVRIANRLRVRPSVLVKKDSKQIDIRDYRPRELCDLEAGEVPNM